MEANEVNKSKFTYPDKLYARTFNNSTLDIGYAPQDMEAVEYTCTDAFMKKAVNWLINNTDISSTGIKNFHKAMEGGNI